VHGGFDFARTYDVFAPKLAAAGWRVIAYDQRGHGDSDKLESGAYAFEDYAADMARVVAALADEAGALPVVVGASLGGLAAILAIWERLTLARALVLVDVTPALDHSGVAKVQGFMAARAGEGFGSLEEAADAVARYLPHRPRPTSLEGLRKNLRLGEDGRWRWHWDPRFLQGPRTVNHGREGIEARMTAAARRLALPVLLVRGAASELVGEAQARAFLDVVPHADFVDVSDARHMVAGDANDAFTDAVVVFTRRIKGES